MRISKNWFTDAVNIYVLLMAFGKWSNRGNGTKPGERNLESEVVGKSVSWERSVYEGLDVLERHWGQMLM